MYVRLPSLIRRHVPGLVAAMVIAAGCASPGAGGGAAVATGNRNVITQAEIEQTSGRTAFEVVQTLRPEYLRGRGVTSSADNPSGGGEPSVFVNGTFYGGTESLGNISGTVIREIRFANARDATTKYGTGYPNGVIEIITK
jgi:hypothetical protein